MQLVKKGSAQRGELVLLSEFPVGAEASAAPLHFRSLRASFARQSGFPYHQLIIQNLLVIPTTGGTCV
jgi:hypothetical protein